MAELALICPKCQAAVNVPIEADAREFTCTECGEASPIHDTLDGLTSNLKDPLIGQIVNECEIQEKVGEGGFGAVYRAFDRNLQRSVALKVMLQSLTSNLEFVQKFIREAVTAAQLNHPNIVAIHKVGRDEVRNLHYLMMEFLDGQTIAEVIEEKGEIPLDEAISTILQCADALAVAQDKNIIHRDIKPENIMIDQHGVVKITDFGLAKVTTTEMKSTKVVGTPHYMSPEQFEGKEVDGRTDIYSLGITFYYMLTRAKPYTGTNTVQIIYSILTQDPRPVMEVNPETPEEVWRIIKKMIAKDLEERYQSFRDVRRDLLAFQERALEQKVTCPQCSAVNVRGRKFCRECGASLMVRCPQCSHEEPAETRHCGECGANIGGLLQIRDNLERGDKLRAFGDLKRAMAFYQEVLKIDPEHEAAQGATKDIQSALSKIDARKSEVDRLVDEGQAEEALEKVESLLSEFPKSDEVKTYGQTVRRSLLLRAVDAHLLVADKAMEEGRMEDALDAYRCALDVDPGREDIAAKRKDLKSRIAALEDTLAAAESAVADGRYTDALSRAKEVLRLKPGHARATEIFAEAREKVASIQAFVDEARVLLDDGRYDEASRRLETAQEISPGDEIVKALLAEAEGRSAALSEKLGLVRRLLAENKPEEALRGAEEVLEEQPDLASAQSLKTEAERLVEAKARLERLEAQVTQGRAREKEGDLDGALAIYMEVLESEPGHERAKNLKGKVEERIQEVRRIRRVADEQYDDGEFSRATDEYQRLIELSPGDEDLRMRAEEAATKRDQLDAALTRAQAELNRQRYDGAEAAAGQALELAPKNSRAKAIGKDVERGRAARDKHLDEASRLIDSELFDDATRELEKAESKGAAPEKVLELRQAADNGRQALLKSDATRSLVLEDFASAIEKYEQILEKRPSDPDAVKGKKVAEKALRSQGRETILPKVVAAAALVLVMLAVQVAAVTRVRDDGVVEETDTARLEIAFATASDLPREKIRETTDPWTLGLDDDVLLATLKDELRLPHDLPVAKAREQRTIKDLAVFATAWKPVVTAGGPRRGDRVVRESAPTVDPEFWSRVISEQQGDLDNFPDDAGLGDDREYASLLRDAFGEADPDYQARVEQLRKAKEIAGRSDLAQLRKVREEFLGKAIADTAGKWFEQVREDPKTSENWRETARAFERIRADDAIQGVSITDQGTETPLESVVTRYVEFAQTMADAEDDLRDGLAVGGMPYADVIADYYARAVESAPDDSFRDVAAAERERTVDAWVNAVRSRVRASRGGRTKVDDFRRDVLDQLMRMRAMKLRNLDLDGLYALINQED